MLPMSHDFQTGYYYISVGGTRGNASYQLRVEIIERNSNWKTKSKLKPKHTVFMMLN